VATLLKLPRELVTLAPTTDADEDEAPKELDADDEEAPKELDAEEEEAPKELDEDEDKDTKVSSGAGADADTRRQRILQGVTTAVRSAEEDEDGGGGPRHCNTCK
jgi:hypothetical protein